MNKRFSKEERKERVEEVLQEVRCCCCCFCCCCCCCYCCCCCCCCCVMPCGSCFPVLLFSFSFFSAVDLHANHWLHSHAPKYFYHLFLVIVSCYQVTSVCSFGFSFWRCSFFLCAGQMGLVGVADSTIGDPIRIRGISGGERKRLSFASEVSDYRFVFFPVVSYLVHAAD